LPIKKIEFMKGIKPGIAYTLTEEVTEEMSASHVGSGLLDVYSTPAMIALMEKTSYLCVQPYLEASESTVGGAVDIRHMKPTAIGQKVVCVSQVKVVENKKIEFELEGTENGIVIGKGTHIRFVIDKESFMKLI
jgi:predicted thioesterase